MEDKMSIEHPLNIPLCCAENKEQDLVDILEKFKSISQHKSRFNFEIISRDKVLEEFPTKSGTAVLLKHNTDYKIKLYNKGDTKCDAILTIDGIVIGTYRIKPLNNMTIERSVDVNKKFTFIIKDKSEIKKGKKRMLSQPELNKQEYGIITVKFIPELKNIITIDKHISKLPTLTESKVNELFSSELDSGNFSDNIPITKNYEYGKTIMEKTSNQEFVTVPLIQYSDEQHIETITIMLFGDTRLI